jgi:hypothetical protein
VVVKQSFLFSVERNRLKLAMFQLYPPNPETDQSRHKSGKHEFVYRMGI